MKRILALLMVGLIMAVMMAASSMPAFAVSPNAIDHACNHDGGASHAPFCTI